MYVLTQKVKKTYGIIIMIKNIVLLRVNII